MKELNQAITGLLWSVDQLYKLIPGTSVWDKTADAIARHRDFARSISQQLDTSLYPYIATHKDEGFTFTPTMMDFVGQSAYRQIGQTSDSGEWISFDDLTIEANPYFKPFKVLV